MSLELTSTLKLIPFLRDAPARALRNASREAQWYSIKAGSALFETGESATHIHFLVSGTLGAFRTHELKDAEFLGHIRQGEPVGEMALFSAGTGDKSSPHTNSVYALRDSEIISLSRTGFDRLIKAEPEILEGLIRLILLRLRQSGRRSARAEPKVFTLVATSPSIDLPGRAQKLKHALGQMGLRAQVINETTGLDKPSAFFEHLENQNDIVILTCQLKGDSWYKLAIRQADRIWIMARADAVPSDPLLPYDTSPARQFKLVDVILLRHPRERLAATPDRWLLASGASRIFHWTDQVEAGSQRLARVMAGRSIGLVFSGGGARAFAHIGVVRALRERRVNIDFVGGTSMGGVIAACVAMGWSDQEIDQRIRKGFVETNPLGDFNLPVVGLVRGRRVDKRLEEHFGDAKIGDMELPFYCVSTNLTDGNTYIHRRGYVRHALRASIALPGILPPIINDGDVLVDGGVLNNFPVDVMQNLHRGFIIGCDVSRSRRGFPADEFIEPPNFFGWVRKHGFKRTPPIASLLMRSATVGVNPSAGKDQTHLYIAPEIINLELRDWESYDSAVEAGYEATLLALDTSPQSFLKTAKMTD